MTPPAAMVLGLAEMWRVPTDRRLFLATVPVLTLGVMGRSGSDAESEQLWSFSASVIVFGNAIGMSADFSGYNY